jgi:3',5'-cyclic AMP phosphodiesterase CpdA
MSGAELAGERVFAISDLHVDHPGNTGLLERLVPRSTEDWLVVGGDISENIDDFSRALDVLRGRFAKVIWVPGNHDLWTYPGDESAPRGERRYRLLVEACQSLGVITPEDPYPIWTGQGGPVMIAPLFLLYDYSFGQNISATKEGALARAYEAGVVCSDEFLLHSEPYPSRAAWCRARVTATQDRLEARETGMATVLVNHFPLTSAPTRALMHPEFAQWCGTTLTEDWHQRFGAVVVVYGHLHIRRTSWEDGVRFEEVSLGYAREWSRMREADLLRQILPLARDA